MRAGRALPRGCWPACCSPMTTTPTRSLRNGCPSLSGKIASNSMKWTAMPLRSANWSAHQRIDKPSRSRLPAPPAKLDELSASPREASAQEGNGVEGKGPDSSDVPSDPCDQDIQIFWKDYPTDALMSKKSALEQWEKLSQAERE